MEEVEQISVFSENKPGKLKRVTEILTEKGINIRAITIASSNSYGIIKILVNNPLKAYQALKEKGLSVALIPVLAVEIEDKPGGLSKIAEVLKEHNINVEDAYGFVIQSHNKAVFIMKVEDIKKTRLILEGENIFLLTRRDLYEI